MYTNIDEYLQTERNAGYQAASFIDHMLAKIDETIAKWLRVLVLAMTKKSSEDITNFLLAKWLKTFYLHSDIETIDRREIIQKLKTGEVDILVWVNLLREGIDLPEVWFIAILDADKEWFLRSTTALIQNIWRAARNPDSEVALYADRYTPSIIKALRETYRRRHHQEEHNTAHWITPLQAISNVKSLESVKTDQSLVQDFWLSLRGKNKRLTRMTKKEKALVAGELKKQLDEAIAQWKFEDAALLRDQLKDLVGE